MRTITDPTEVRYALDVIMDLARVSDGSKDLLIVSEGKSTLAYETVSQLADDSGLFWQHTMLQCEDGELHEHLFVARHCGDIEKAIDLIFERVGGYITRARLQLQLGLMLGYELDDIFRFIFSPKGVTCPCDCCGGEPQLLLTYQPAKIDGNPSRFVENAYQY